MNTVVDTSVWISHFKKSDPVLLELLRNKQILMHSSILGELISGNIQNRAKTIFDLKMIPFISEPEREKIHDLIESKKLYGKGLGWVDFEILASCITEKCSLYTHDKMLKKVYSSLT